MILRPASNVVGVSRRPTRLVAVVLVAAAVTAGCSASSTTTVTGTGPGPVKCGVSLADPSVVDAGGGAARLSIATQPECAWTVSSAVNWISGLSPASGQGSGDVEFRVTPNDGSSAREGDIVVNESRVRVSQRAPCRYNVGPQNQSVNAGADAGGVTVATQSECGWTATTDVGWIKLSSPLSGNGNGSVSFTVSSNGGAERTGSIIIAGQSSVVTQAAAQTPPPASGPAPAPLPPLLRLPLRLLLRLRLRLLLRLLLLPLPLLLLLASTRFRQTTRRWRSARERVRSESRQLAPARGQPAAMRRGSL